MSTNSLLISNGKTRITYLLVNILQDILKYWFRNAHNTNYQTYLNKCVATIISADKATKELKDFPEKSYLHIYTEPLNTTFDVDIKPKVGVSMCSLFNFTN